MKKIVLFIFCLILIGCQSEYKIQFLDKYGNILKEESFASSNDSTAFFKAYQKFIIAKKVEGDMVKHHYLSSIETESFKVLNEKNEIITDLLISGSEEIKDSISKKIMKIQDTFKENGSQKRENIEVDSDKIAELKPYFNEKEDEFDVDKRKFFTPKTAAKYTNANSIYFYFSATENGVSKLRLKVQYCASDWLFINKYIFNIDGTPIEFNPREVKRDNNYGQIWEWSDDQMTEFEASLIDLIQYCKTIKVKFVGDKYEKVRVLQSKEVQSMKRTIELYYAMGGSI